MCCCWVSKELRHGFQILKIVLTVFKRMGRFLFQMARDYYKKGELDIGFRLDRQPLFGKGARARHERAAEIEPTLGLII